jgi:hypothetical protein
MKLRALRTGIVEVDRMLDAQITLMLCYDEYRALSKGSWCDSPALRSKLQILLPPQRFLMVGGGLY